MPLELNKNNNNFNTEKKKLPMCGPTTVAGNMVATLKLHSGLFVKMDTSLSALILLRQFR
jgi:hypothetical protein